MRLIVLLFVFVSSAAYAQQQPLDPAFLQRALTAVQTQRNLAFDGQAVAEARAAALADDLAKANAKIKELEARKVEDK